MRVLIVEDEVRLAEALGQIMSEQKYAVDVVYTGTDGLDYALSGLYDVIVLDVMLPGRSGFDIVRELRAHKLSTPVLMLTARDETADKVTGLDCGADDYMTKPFVPDELLARVRALSRRQGEVVLEEMRYGDLTLHLSTYTLQCGAKSIHLGFKEYEVLRILMVSPQYGGAQGGAADQGLGDGIRRGGQQCGGLYFVPAQEVFLSRIPRRHRHGAQGGIPAGRVRRQDHAAEAAPEICPDQYAAGFGGAADRLHRVVCVHLPAIV